MPSIGLPDAAASPLELPSEPESSPPLEPEVPDVPLEPEDVPASSGVEPEEEPFELEHA